MNRTALITLFLGLTLAACGEKPAEAPAAPAPAPAAEAPAADAASAPAAPAAMDSAPK